MSAPAVMTDPGPAGVCAAPRPRARRRARVSASRPALPARAPWRLHVSRHRARPGRRGRRAGRLDAGGRRRACACRARRRSADRGGCARAIPANPAHWRSRDPRSRRSALCAAPARGRSRLVRPVCHGRRAVRSGRASVRPMPPAQRSRGVQSPRRPVTAGRGRPRAAPLGRRGSAPAFTLLVGVRFAGRAPQRARRRRAYAAPVPARSPRARSRLRFAPPARRAWLRGADRRPLSACVRAPWTRTSWARIPASRACVSAPAVTCARASASSWSRLRPTCWSALVRARSRPASASLRRCSASGAGVASLRLSQPVRSHAARGVVERPDPTRRASEGRGASRRPCAKCSAWWRWLKAPHHSTEINSHCVHQPSRTLSSTCSTASSAPKRNEKISLDVTAPSSRSAPLLEDRAAAFAQRGREHRRRGQQQVQQARQCGPEQAHCQEPERQQHPERAGPDQEQPDQPRARCRSACGTRPARRSVRGTVLLRRRTGR